MVLAVKGKEVEPVFWRSFKPSTLADNWQKSHQEINIGIDTVQLHTIFKRRVKMSRRKDLAGYCTNGIEG